jgi:streptomycin 6-kinase
VNAPTVTSLASLFADYLDQWDLTPDGRPIVTPTSRLPPVCAGRVRAMLKIAALDQERLGNLVMNYWSGDGAAAVLAHGENAILMERAEHSPSLADVTRNRGDDEAVASSARCWQSSTRQKVDLRQNCLRLARGLGRSGARLRTRGKLRPMRYL